MAITNGSLIKRGNLWHWKYRLDGVVNWESLKVSTKREAELVRQARIAQYHNDKNTFLREDKNPTIDELRKLYVEWAAIHLRPKTIEAALWSVGHFERITRCKTFGQVTPAKLDTFKRGMLKEKYSPVSVNNALRGLRAFVNHARKNGWLTCDNPFANVKPLSQDKKKPLWLDADEDDDWQIDAALRAAEAHSDNAHLFFAMALYAGLRKGELDAAQWAWINWKRKFIHVQSSGPFVIKDKDKRTIPLHSKLAEILTPHKRREGFIIAPESEWSAYRYRFDIRKTFKAVVDAAGVPWCTPHTLRHTFASQLATRGVSLYKIGDWLGHSDPKTTKIYAHLAPHDEEIELL